MSRKDLVLLGSRVVVVYLTVWTFSEASALPGSVYSFLYYLRYKPSPTANLEYLDFLRHSHLIGLAFLIVRIIGLSLLTMWIHRGGPEIENLLLPPTEESTST
jgi:hypothetical protein